MIKFKIFLKQKYLKMRRWRNTNNNKRFGFLFFILLIVFILIIISIQILNNILLPSILMLAEEKVKIEVTKITNNKIETSLKNVDFLNFITLQENEDSKVMALQADILKMNKLSFNIAIDIEEELNSSKPIYVYVSLGNIFKNSFLANRGPKMEVKVLAYGSVNTEFKTEFETAGINQTRHKIYLDIVTDTLIILPMTKKKFIIETKVPISETVVVGDIPEGFIDFNGNLKGILSE